MEWRTCLESKGGAFIENAINAIAAMRGREIPDIAANSLRKLFENTGEKNTKAIVGRLKGYDNIPSNIVGVCERINNEFAIVAREEEEWHEKNDDLFGTSDELKQIAIFNEELRLWLEAGLFQYDHDGLQEPMNIEEWIAAERPKTWSPVLDHWMHGFEKAYFEDQKTPGVVLDFLMRYNTMLKEQRIKRTEHGSSETAS